MRYKMDRNRFHSPEPGECSREGCTILCYRRLWITVKGQDVHWRFCDDHFMEEHEAEEAYRKGL